MLPYPSMEEEYVWQKLQGFHHSHKWAKGTPVALPSLPVSLLYRRALTTSEIACHAARERLHFCNDPGKATTMYSKTKGYVRLCTDVEP